MIYKRVLRKHTTLCGECCFGGNPKIRCGLTDMSAKDSSMIRDTLGNCWDFKVPEGYSYVYKIATLNSKIRTL